jgi:hypothetical protein
VGGWGSGGIYIGPSLTLVFKHQSISSDPLPVFSKIGKPVLTFPPMDFKYQNWFWLLIGAKNLNFCNFRQPSNVNFHFQTSGNLFLMGQAKKLKNLNSMQVRQQKAQFCANFVPGMEDKGNRGSTRVQVRWIREGVLGGRIWIPYQLSSLPLL